MKWRTNDRWKSARDNGGTTGPLRHVTTDTCAETAGGEEFSFAPSINPLSERLLEESWEVPSNFFERQRYFHEARHAKLKQLQQQLVRGRSDVL